MSHELRTPLSVVIGYTDILSEGTFGPLMEQEASALRMIRRNAFELLDLITAILDLSRLEAGRLPLEIKEIQMPALLEEIKAETQGVWEQSKLAFVWNITDKLPLLRTDPGKLKMVIKNLIGNAVKFTEQGSIAVEAHGQQGGIAISVSDTGIGIPPAEVQNIFEPFLQVERSTTRRYGGIGLGLHIVRRLLEMLGGTVEVQSTVGHGSTFRVWIPSGRSTPTS
jgi:signal transduction histidine kinase